MQTKLVSVTGLEPISLEEAKRQLQIVAADTSFDTLITSLISVVREVAENETALELRNVTYETSLASFPSILALPKNPVQQVLSIKYIDADGTERTMPTDDYVLDMASMPERIHFAGTPATNRAFNAVKIEYTAGYSSPAGVPRKTWQAMLMLLTHFFENRGNLIDGRFTIEMPMGVNWLFAKDRVYL